jgi:hypothetical protein
MLTLVHEGTMASMHVLALSAQSKKNSLGGSAL